MTKPEKIEAMLGEYDCLEAADIIAVCFELEGVPMVHYCDVMHLQPFMELTEASEHHGRELSLRLCKLNKRLLAFLSEVCHPIGTAEDLQRALEDTSSGGRMNRGLAYEKLFFEFFGQTWKRDSKAWWRAPDFTFPDGTRVQIKSPRAMFTTEGQLARVKQELGR